MAPAPNFASGSVWTGDNLPVLRGMNDACVDLIYLDPPFNSNRTYEAPIGSKAAGAAFKDAWTLNDVDVYEHGELADRNPAAYSVIEAARQVHGKGMQSYCIMMTVRLFELHRVLKPTGSIYLHCDDTAGHWLRVLMDAVFGGSAFRNEIVWKRIGNHNDAGRFGRTGDRLLFYGSDIRRGGGAHSALRRKRDLEVPAQGRTRAVSARRPHRPRARRHNRSMARLEPVRYRETLGRAAYRGLCSVDRSEPNPRLPGRGKHADTT